MSIIVSYLFVSQEEELTRRRTGRTTQEDLSCSTDGTDEDFRPWSDPGDRSTDETDEDFRPWSRRSLSVEQEIDSFSEFLWAERVRVCG